MVPSTPQTPALDASWSRAKGEEHPSQARKIVFFVGTNQTAHYVLRHVIDNLACHGIPCDVYLTDVIPLSEAHKARISTPEAENFSFYEKLMINHGYPVLESTSIILDTKGNLDNRLSYSPTQLGHFFSRRGVPVTVKNLYNINDPRFVDQVTGDDRIALAYNIRNMQKWHKPLIGAIESKTMNGHQGRGVNAHPGDALRFPGTNIAFWVRMTGSNQNVWTLHEIDEGIDTGPFLDRTSKAVDPSKTLLQDMMTMAEPAAQMIINDATMFFDGTPRPSTPQAMHEKPNKNYTYATHEQWLQAAEKGIRIVSPKTYIDALVREHTGSLTKRVSRELRDTLERATLEWQHEYLRLHQETYGTAPPEYNPEHPEDFFIHLSSLEANDMQGSSMQVGGKITAAPCI